MIFLSATLTNQKELIMNMGFKSVLIPEYFFYANAQNLVTIELLIYSALATRAGYENLPTNLDVYNKE